MIRDILRHLFDRPLAPPLPRCEYLWCVPHPDTDRCIKCRRPMGEDDA